MTVKMRKWDWFDNEHIKPYIFIKTENRPKNPGSKHNFIFKKDWIDFNPLHVDKAHFGNAILELENKAFQSRDLAMSKWVFYDCSVLPGIICGYAIKTKMAPQILKDIFPTKWDLEWLPLSLFIAIPAAEQNHWIAHNLCSVNNFLKNEDKYYGLGFLSKAFGLWYTNIENLYGVTQWDNPALKLHSNFGLFQLVSAFSPLHKWAASLTYKSQIDVRSWHWFLDKSKTHHFDIKNAGFTIHPKKHSDLEGLQKKIENGEGPFYFNGPEVLESGLSKDIHLYIKK